MKKTIIQQFKRLNIFAQRPYLDCCASKTLVLPFEEPYFLVRTYRFLTNTDINKALHKNTIVAYIRINGIHHFLYYLKKPEAQEKLHDYVTKNNDLEYVPKLELHSTDSVHIIQKNLPKSSTISLHDKPDDVQAIPNTSDEEPTPACQFNLDKSKEKPDLYLYKTLLPHITDYKQFQCLCYLLHILKVSNTLATYANSAFISFGDITALLPKCLKYSNERTSRERKSKYIKSFDYFLHFIQDIEPLVDIYEDDNPVVKKRLLEIVLHQDFKQCLCKKPYITVPLDFVNKFDKNNYQFLMYFLQYLFNVNPQNTFIVKISTQELLKKTGIINSSTHSTNATIVARVNKYFEILFQHHITPRPYVLTVNDIKKNTILKIELKRFQMSKDFNPILSTPGMNMENIEDET